MKRNEPTLVQKAIQKLEGFDIYQCPRCKKGQMHIIEVLPQIRTPRKFLQLRTKSLTS